MYFPIKSILQQILERSNLAILAAKVDTLFSDIAMMPSTQCNVRGFCKSSPPGGILDVKEARMQLYSPDTPPNLHGVMIGRGALANPCMLVEADALYGDELPGLTRRQALDEYLPWLFPVLAGRLFQEGVGGRRSGDVRISASVRGFIGLLPLKGD